MKLVSGADIFWIRYVEVLVRGRLEKKEESICVFCFCCLLKINFKKIEKIHVVLIALDNLNVFLLL